MQVNFKPIEDVSSLPPLEGVEIRVAELTDVITTIRLLEHALVDYSSFERKAMPVVISVKTSMVSMGNVLTKYGSAAELRPIVDMFTLDLAELRTKIKQFAAEDPA